MKKKRLKSACFAAAVSAAFIIALFALTALTGCGSQEQDKTIKIAVMGNPEDFPPQYEEGIKAAAEQANAEYSESGYSVECVFYEDDGSYIEGASIIDSLAKDDQITAIIGSQDMDISKTAAHVYADADKLFVMPYFLYDSVYENNNYDMIFSMCNSARTVGECLRIAAENTSAKRWAVCAAEDEFSSAEMSGFMGYVSTDGIQTVDCVSAKALKNNFDRIYKRWETLGVEGVMLFPGKENGFELFKAIYDRNPNIVCGGDTEFDNFEFLKTRPDIMQIIPGFIMADEYAFEEVDEDGKPLSKISGEYEKKTGKDFDSWFLQGYNAVKMIADTAVKANTTDGVKIADFLHENGYEGFFQKFMFDEKGKQVTQKYRYGIYLESGAATTVEVDKQ